MEVTTTPLRWAKYQGNSKETKAEREGRATKTNITQLNYLSSGSVIQENYKTSKSLSQALEKESEKEDDDQVQLRLYVVEDLSRDVIELLGARLDIEPAFFRSHIVDYAWYNTRDRWMDPPNLSVIAERQRWFQLRFVTARYFKTLESFKKGRDETMSFNVFRRLDDDRNKAHWDEPGALVGITRTRASFWLKRAQGQKKEAVGECCPIWNESWYCHEITTTGAPALTCVYGRRLIARSNDQGRISTVVRLSQLGIHS